MKKKLGLLTLLGAASGHRRAVDTICTVRHSDARVVPFKQDMGTTLSKSREVPVRPDRRATLQEEATYRPRSAPPLTWMKPPSQQDHVSGRPIDFREEDAEDMSLLPATMP